MASPERGRGECGLQTGSADLSFLATAPPRILELYRYWEQKRGDRAMPRRCDIAPEDFRWHLPGILLVDVEGVDGAGQGIYRYRVVGTREVKMRGRDPTGMLVRDGFFGPSVEDAIACYEQVRRGHRLYYDAHEYCMPEGKRHEGVTLFLPLSEDGETVTQILVYAESRNPPESDDLIGAGFSPPRSGGG